MRKKFICVVLTLAAVLAFCVIPAGADPADQDLPYVELMDYLMSPVDEIMPGAFYVMDEYDYVGNFILTLGEISAFGYEITYSYTGNQPTVTGTSFGYVSDNNFKARYVEGTNIGKIRGSFDGTTGCDFGISFRSEGCYITVHSFRVFLVENYQVNLPAVLFGNGQAVSWYPDSAASVATTGYGSIEIDDWRNFDIINVSATLGGYGITSVTARLVDNTSTVADIVIPFEMNYVNLSDYDGEHENVLLTMSCDMRAVDPATAPDSTLIISITTAVPSGSYGYIQPTSIYGSVLIDSPDEYIPWLKLIVLGIYENTEMTFSTLFSIFDSLESLENSLSFFFENQSNLLGEIKQQISNSFEDWETFWNTSLDEKISSYQEWLLALEGEKLSGLFLYGFEPLKDKLDELVNGAPVDDAVSDGMTSAGDQLAELGAQMAAGTPQVSTKVDVSIPEVPNDGSAVLATTMFSFFWGQDYIIKMLLTAVALATLSYIFFGKKG